MKHSYKLPNNLIFCGPITVALFVRGEYQGEITVSLCEQLIRRNMIAIHVVISVKLFCAEVTER